MEFQLGESSSASGQEPLSRHCSVSDELPCVLNRDSASLRLCLSVAAAKPPSPGHTATAPQLPRRLRGTHVSRHCILAGRPCRRSRIAQRSHQETEEAVRCAAAFCNHRITVTRSRRTPSLTRMRRRRAPARWRKLTARYSSTSWRPCARVREKAAETAGCAHRGCAGSNFAISSASRTSTSRSTASTTTRGGGSILRV